MKPCCGFIPPEQAADLTEARWLFRSQLRTPASEPGCCCMEPGSWLSYITTRSRDEATGCGWCDFARALWVSCGSRDTDACAICPVSRVFGCHCTDVPAMRTWASNCGWTQVARDAALDVYELAVSRRVDLITAAREILDEVFPEGRPVMSISKEAPDASGVFS